VSRRASMGAHCTACSQAVAPLPPKPVKAADRAAEKARAKAAAEEEKARVKEEAARAKCVRVACVICCQ
jgi:hypothetical protein